MIEVETRDVDEAVDAVSGVYCTHTLTLDARSRSITTRLTASGSGALAHVGLRYGARVAVDAGELDDLLLVMHATRGTAQVRQAQHHLDWWGGRTAVVGGDRATEFRFDPMFAQSSLRLSPMALRDHLQRLLGVELQDDLHFELRCLPPDVESVWSQLLGLSVHAADLSGVAVDHLHQLVLDVLVRRCAHNFSHLLAVDEPVARPRLAREAVALCDDLPGYAVLTVGDLAAHLGVSIRSVERSFRDAGLGPPARYLRERRLDRVRRELEISPTTRSITDLAVAHGFYHPGRFAQYYKQRFGETPSATVNRFGA